MKLTRAAATVTIRRTPEEAAMLLASTQERCCRAQGHERQRGRLGHLHDEKAFVVCPRAGARAGADSVGIIGPVAFNPAGVADAACPRERPTAVRVDQCVQVHRRAVEAPHDRPVSKRPTQSVVQGGSAYGDTGVVKGAGIGIRITDTVAVLPGPQAAVLAILPDFEAVAESLVRSGRPPLFGHVSADLPG